MEPLERKGAEILSGPGAVVLRRYLAASLTSSIVKGASRDDGRPRGKFSSRTEAMNEALSGSRSLRRGCFSSVQLGMGAGDMTLE